MMYRCDTCGRPRFAGTSPFLSRVERGTIEIKRFKPKTDIPQEAT